MQHLRLVVVDLADAVAAVLAHHREPFGFGIGLDRRTDIAEGRPRPDRPDAAEHRLAGHIDQPRSEEHTSELQALMRISYAVFCLKTKNKQINTNPKIYK